jgi:enoyl-CoA hydratase/carnithine racemase
MSYTFICVEKNETILDIKLDRPEKRNALTLEMISELISAFREAGESDAAAITLSASGPVFCAGHDFNDMIPRDLAAMRELMHTCSQLMQLIHQLPRPVIASVQGPAVGAGCQLALSCDLVVAAEEASFRSPGGAGGWFCFTPMVALSRAVGRKRALEMLLCGDPVGAGQAADWGMVNRVVPAGRLVEATQELARRASQGSRLMIGLGKEAYYAQIELDEAQAYQYAAELMASTGTMPDARARMNRFIRK